MYTPIKLLFSLCLVFSLYTQSSYGSEIKGYEVTVSCIQGGGKRPTQIDRAEFNLKIAKNKMESYRKTVFTGLVSEHGDFKKYFWPVMVRLQRDHNDLSKVYVIATGSTIANPDYENRKRYPNTSKSILAMGEIPGFKKGLWITGCREGDRSCVWTSDSSCEVTSILEL